MTTVEGILLSKNAAVVSIGAHDTILEAARSMNENHIGALVVIEGGTVLGILSERDILVRIVAAHRDPAAVTVKDVMTSPVVCCEPHTALEEVRDVMAQRSIRHVPVIDRRRRLTGILATGDLLQQRIAESQSTIDTLCAYIHGPGVHVDGRVLWA